MGLRIVIVNQAPTRPLLEAAEALAERGHEVTMVAAASHLSEEIRGVATVRLGEYDPRTSFTRLRSWIAFAARAALVFLRLPASTVVVACTNPPLLPHVAAAAGTIRGFACVFRILDVYPDVLQAVGYGRSSLVCRCLARCNRWSYARCVALCTLGDTMATTLAAYAPRSRIEVIPEWIPATNRSWPYRPKPPTDPFIVLVAGNAGLTHDITPLVTASRLLATKNVKFLVSTVNAPAMSRLFSGCDNVRIVPRFCHLDYMAALRTADAAFLSLRAGAAEACYPSRTLAYLANGLPIIAVTTRPSDLASSIERGPCGVVVDPSQGGQGVAEAIRHLMTSASTLGEMRDAAISLAKSAFNPDRCRRELVSLIEAAGASHGA
jgi:colanic acid biosynthesis glycosyl transferase WcaI